jgi:hypothetical protein
MRTVTGALSTFEILSCQAVNIEDLQRQAEIVAHQNLTPDEGCLAHQVFKLLQSIRGCEARRAEQPQPCD